MSVNLRMIALVLALNYKNEWNFNSRLFTIFKYTKKKIVCDIRFFTFGSDTNC